MFEGHAVTVEGDVARLETRVYLGSQLLRDLDAMSMAHSLEVRVPFVDHELLGEVWPDLGSIPA
jgi:Asparagine synthase.